MAAAGKRVHTQPRPPSILTANCPSTGRCRPGTKACGLMGCATAVEPSCGRTVEGSYLLLFLMTTGTGHFDFLCDRRCRCCLGTRVTGMMTFSTARERPPPLRESRIEARG